MAIEAKAGDVLLFRGTGSVSWTIALATNRPSQWFSCAPSHVGIVAELDGRLLLVESTTLCDLPCEIQHKRIRGVQAHDIGARIAAYKGHVWHMPVALDWRLSEYQSRLLSRFCKDHLGDGYDYDGLARTPLEHVLTFLKAPKHNTVCSRFVARAAMHAGLTGHDVIPDGLTPAEIARDWPRTEIYESPVRVK